MVSCSDYDFEVSWMLNFRLIFTIRCSRRPSGSSHLENRWKERYRECSPPFSLPELSLAICDDLQTGFLFSSRSPISSWTVFELTENASEETLLQVHHLFRYSMITIYIYSKRLEVDQSATLSFLRTLVDIGIGRCSKMQRERVVPRDYPVSSIYNHSNGSLQVFASLPCSLQRGTTRNRRVSIRTAKNGIVWMCE